MSLIPRVLWRSLPLLHSTKAYACFTSSFGSFSCFSFSHAASIALLAHVNGAAG